ncbi:GNAT domain-containing protein [Dactylonectria macrodidyma]|uniref:GNAT domain-containing protein n=1 Tax=Dactylonectria macrodidyma TaxID=307937 RepID=A0A9P9E8Q5_9HYPO|nr:GNAT domain-containing protein [Dactylonectria macrodidyma]
MAQHQPTKPGFVRVKTTLTKEPYPPLEDRPVLRTERLILKPYYEGAAKDLFPMRLQPEVMMWTSQGVPDNNLEETKQWVSQRLPPHHQKDYSFVISLISTDEVIGTGGTYRRACELGWPEIGYAFRKEAWGKGFATEFLRAFLQVWWKLPRIESWVEVDQVTLTSEELASNADMLVQERCGAVTIRDNLGSKRVLEKTGFKNVIEWKSKTKEWILCGWVLAEELQVLPNE